MFRHGIPCKKLLPVLSSAQLIMAKFSQLRNNASSCVCYSSEQIPGESCFHCLHLFVGFALELKPPLK